jgi:hypothetical protein
MLGMDLSLYAYRHTHDTHMAIPKLFSINM